MQPCLLRITRKKKFYCSYGEAAYMKSKWKKCKGFVLDVIDQVLQESEFYYL